MTKDEMERVLRSAVYLIQQMHDTTNPEKHTRGEHKHTVAALHVLTWAWLRIHDLVGSDDPA